MSTAITHEESLEQFSKQIEFVLNSYVPHNLQINNYNSIVLGGLGGSGIGAKIVSDYMQVSLSIPAQLIGDYHLPAYVNKKTLVILCSYSGNTEETLSLLSEAKAKGCQILAITSGGKLLEECQANKFIRYPVETGYQPRMTLGYSLSTLLLIFAELSGKDFKADLASAQNTLSQPEPLKNKAKEIISFFNGLENQKFVTVCDTNTIATGIRFCQQLQENAKAEAYTSLLPENNHNMIETYYGPHPSNFILFNSGTNARVNKRFVFIKALLNKNGNKVYDFSLTEFNIPELFKAIYILDWVSVYLSNERKEDNMLIQNIMDLKANLSN